MSDSTTLNIRGLDPAVRDQIVAAKGARGLSYAEYITRLVKLHQVCLESATVLHSDSVPYHATVDPVNLTDLGLEAVTV